MHHWRTQKSFCKLVLRERYRDYDTALLELDLETLSSRRETLMTKFAKTSIENQKLHKLFPLRNTEHEMQLRDPPTYRTTKANTERFYKSSILHMQRTLNEEE